MSLIQKYNIPGPRYTSYPTVPYWDKQGIAPEDWITSVRRSFAESKDREGISLYIHLPYCERLCTFCGCNKRITKNHAVETPYIDALLREWQMYLDLLDRPPLIKEIHLGGGTPTFFSPEQLQRLITGLFAGAEQDPHPEFSFEGHPNNTTRAHLQALFDLGFTRCSFGVQDYDPVVQRTINRIQPFERVAEATRSAREVGYTSVGHDLVFGLPLQHLSSIEDSIARTAELMPDRIAFYSYAHVPWIKGNGQRGFDENDLPRHEEKRALYERGRELLESHGYLEIGMDHFALPHDSLYESLRLGRLHRNFMGYTNSHTQLMIGLGVSSISDSWYAFAQNEKTVEGYYARLQAGELPVFRGHLLSDEDLLIRRHILNIMCRMETGWEEDGENEGDGKMSKLVGGSNEMIRAMGEPFPELTTCLERLEEMEADGLLVIGEDGLTVTEAGRPFIRNICMAFDLRLIRNKPTTRIFSMTI